MNARPDHVAIEQAGNKELLLASMRLASANLRGWQIEIETCGVALKGGAISLDDACEWMNELGLLTHLPESDKGGSR